MTVTVTVTGVGLAPQPPGRGLHLFSYIHIYLIPGKVLIDVFVQDSCVDTDLFCVISVSLCHGLFYSCSTKHKVMLQKKFSGKNTDVMKQLFFFFYLFFKMSV